MGTNDIVGLHHVGLLVGDMDAAIGTFRRLGFHIGPPAYPALPPSPGAEPEPVGAGNTHADFRRSFIELLAIAPEQRAELPADAELVPLQIPDDRLDATRTAIRHSIAGLADRLDRAEGAHILMFATADAERTATRLGASGTANTGAVPAQRPVTTAAGTELAAIKYLEIQDDSGSLPPEGRIGAAEDAPPAILDAQTGLKHPNGAVALAECVLCTADDALDSTAERYERYLGITAERQGDTRGFALGSGRLTITTTGALSARLPGERPSFLPALGAYAVEVADLAATEQFLGDSGLDLRLAASGEPFIPAATAHGAAIAFTEAGSRA